jgi:hypothetical protein
MAAVSSQPSITGILMSLKDDVDRSPRIVQLPQGLQTVRRLHDAIAGVLKQPPYDVQQRVLVVDDQDRLAGESARTTLLRRRIRGHRSVRWSEANRSYAPGASSQRHRCELLTELSPSVLKSIAGERTGLTDPPSDIISESPSPDSWHPARSAASVLPEQAASQPCWWSVTIARAPGREDPVQYLPLSCR